MQIRLQQGVPKITRAYIYSPFMSVTSHLTNKLTKQNNLIYHSLRDQISAEGNCCLSDFSCVSLKDQGLEMVVKWTFVGCNFWATPSIGQLISKWFFGVINFLQKTNKQIQLYYYDTLGCLVIVRFLEEIDNPKKTF